MGLPALRRHGHGGSGRLRGLPGLESDRQRAGLRRALLPAMRLPVRRAFRLAGIPEQAMAREGALMKPPGEERVEELCEEIWSLTEAGRNTLQRVTGGSKLCLLYTSPSPRDS